ncbi:alpha/beta hydrolase [Alkalihalobacterium sp. APHAB7]|uniref:alpha/beta hydrolase n=1 Tax=Alkalihalobacterium sp. APHAB7 TaxID=3402081 RepID=UPI003AAE7FBA
MKSFLLNEKKKLHFWIQALVVANGLSIIVGFIYILTNVSHGLWNIFGIFLFLTLISNVIITIVDYPSRSLDYLYLCVTILTVPIVPIMNKYVSEQVTHASSRSVISLILIFLLFILGGVLASNKLYHLKNHHFYSKPYLNKNKTSGPNKIIKRSLVFLLSTILALGIYVSYELLIGRGANFVEVAVPQLSLFFSIIFLTVAVFLLKITNLRLYPRRFILLLGITLATIFTLPVIMTPFTISETNLNYIQAFRSDPKQIVPTAEEMHFMQTPFSLPDYFYGTKSGNYRVKENILYYEGTEGVDKGIKLHFDVYRPPANEKGLPGHHSVLIRIHGGGWTSGDKGSLNNAQLNKHFASQGYVVFDVQHGLSDGERVFKFLKVPENIVGNFSTDDMVRHIGIFTDYLADHYKEYGANLDSVFVSGNSSGGHLANAVGLANTRYDYLNPKLKIKGVIPVYPANGLASIVGIDGSDDIMDPSLLVAKDSPPVLICQGTHDGIVDQTIAIQMDKTYKKIGNEKSALILLPYAGHASNSYYSGNFNQLFIYYMERFMYQFK